MCIRDSIQTVIGAAVQAIRPAIETIMTTVQMCIRDSFSPDGNLYEYRFIRAAGFGALNRTAALAFQIGNAAYQIPAGYATPMPA